MEPVYDQKFDMFTKCILTSLFVGIAVVYTNLLFDMLFRYTTKFNLSAIINVSSIIMGCVILVVICGVLYYGFRVWFKDAANPAFTAAMVVITAICVWKILGIVRSPIHKETIEFRELLIGIMSITGLLAGILIPLFYSNDKLVRQII